ncbi:MAG: XRE family transcriptional regulator [Gemmatimonadaceae bacterium]
MPRPLTGPRHSRWGGPDRVHMLIRRKLLDLFLELARRDGLNYRMLAHVLRTSRPRACTLLNGQIERFNSETLIDILARLGVDVEIIVVRRRGYLRWNIPNPRPGWKPPPDVAMG